MVYLILALALIPTAAEAAPITAFFVGLGIGPGLAAVLTNLTISAGLNVAASLLSRRQGAGQRAQDAKVNVRLENAERWQLGGTVAAGGSVGTFAEHDADGNLWYIVAHGDAELTGAASYLLDDIPVTLSNGSGGFTAGDVLTDEFCLTDKGAQYEGTGTRVPVFRLYTVTPDASNPYGALPAAFTTAFPDSFGVGDPLEFFRLAGVCFTIVRCKAVKPESRYTAYHWRGALGLGEPSVVLIGNFNRMYDPREVGHDIDDPTTWTASDGNAAIVAANFRVAKYGRNRPMSEVAWDKVAEQADICDQTVLDRSAVPTPLYRAGYAFPDSMARAECEQQILAAADAIPCYDASGKWYPLVGYYSAPTLEISAARDIFSSQTQITDDGETAVDGVVVYYTEPGLNYTRQPCAPWQNPDWFNASAIPNYLTVEIPTCQNHNQAVRLAKAIGTRVAATKRAALVTSIKGILAKDQRGIDLALDDVFTGPHEIVAPVEEDPSGVACAMAVVPMPVDKWYLNGGEEGVPPADTPDLGLTDTLAAPSGVVLTTDGSQIKATFSAPARSDRVFRFRYRIASSSDGYQYFTVNMDDLVAYSAAVTNGKTYEVSWQARTNAGRETAWSSTSNILIQSNPTAPASLAAAGAAGGVGAATATFTTANDENQYAVAIWRGATNVFGSATKISTVYAGPNVASFATETGLAAGTWYFWAQPLNNSAIAGTASGPFTVTVT
jgi:hypothetical protein